MDTPEQQPNPTCPGTDASSESDIATPSPSPPNGSGVTSTKQDPSSSLSPNSTEPSPSSPSSRRPISEEYPQIPLSLIQQRDPLNGRLQPDDDALADLTRDIAANGLLHPITLARDGERYTLIAGGRRLQAARRLHWKTIAAAIREADDAEQATLRFLENNQRSTLSPVEEAKQLANMIENDPTGLDAIAERLGRRREWIEDRLEMIEWPAALMHAVHNKQISLGAAKHLARIAPPNLRDNRIHHAILHGINVRTASLWRSDALLTGAPESEMPLFPSTTQNQMPQTETRFHCFACRDAFPLDQTTPLRLCTTCMTAIKSQLEPAPLHDPIPPPRPPDQQTQPDRATPTLLGPYEQYPGDNDQPDSDAHRFNQHREDPNARQPQ